MKTMHEKRKRLARVTLLACMGAGTALLMVPFGVNGAFGRRSN